MIELSNNTPALTGLLKWIESTRSFRKTIGSPVLRVGYFANVLDIGGGLGLAVSADGVGTKLLVAQMMNKFDTIGIDCIAMNVNDILCVGAEPISVLNYLAVQDLNSHLLEEIGKGLCRGAEIARISIAGGETAQLKEIITGAKDGYAFDLSGMGVGLVSLDKIITGKDIEEGDVIVGLRSTGIHSNGLTLARQILFDKMGLRVNSYLDELGKTVGEELLEPTRIYVPEVMAMLSSDLEIKALIHITGGGFLNLKRVEKDIGFKIDKLPEPPVIFPLLKRLGNINHETMFSTYNMGIGFCVVLPEKMSERAIEIARNFGTEAFKIGYAVKERGVFINS